jgi:hypothetical protein
MSAADLSVVLTSIQVSIAALGGDMKTLAAEMRGQMALHGEGIAQLRTDVVELEAHAVALASRIASLEETRTLHRGKAAGISVAAALLGSGTTAGLFKLVAALSQ